MKIKVKVKPNSKAESVERLTQEALPLGLNLEMDVYKVSVKEPPIDGRANVAVVKALAKYFEVAPSLINLISGKISKNKIFEIQK